MQDPELCEHLERGTWPLATELVLDDHLGPTDALVLCRQCRRPYLLEMLDWQGDLRIMRVSVLDPAESARLVRDLTRGSCDVSRAGNEIAHFTNRARFSRSLLLVDARAVRIVAIVPAPDDRPLPSAAWRELPCDGSWVDYARSYTDMVNG